MLSPSCFLYFVLIFISRTTYCFLFIVKTSLVCPFTFSRCPVMLLKNVLHSKSNWLFTVVVWDGGKGCTVKYGIWWCIWTKNKNWVNVKRLITLLLSADCRFKQLGHFLLIAGVPYMYYFIFKYNWPVWWLSFAQLWCWMSVDFDD